jgi:hypothetical protein
MTLIETLTQRNEAFASSRFSAALKIMPERAQFGPSTNNVVTQRLALARRAMPGTSGLEKSEVPSLPGNFGFEVKKCSQLIGSHSL